MRQLTTTGLALSSLLALSACAVPQQPGYGAYSAPPIRTAPVAMGGTVTQVQAMQVPQGVGSASIGAGAVAGGVVGGVIGNSVSNRWNRDSSTLLGVVGGAVAGHLIQSHAQNTVQPGYRESYRVTVQTDDGYTRVFDYPTPPPLRQGDRVQVQGNQLYR